MVNENERGLACIMCATPRPRPRSRTTVVVVDTAVAASSMMARAESNDGMVRYDRGNDGRGAGGAVSLPRAPSRTKAVATAAATASSMARVESNDGNDGTVRYDPLYASCSSTLSAMTTTLKREWSLADMKDTKKRHNCRSEIFVDDDDRKPPTERYTDLLPTQSEALHAVRGMSKREWSASDQIQRNGDEAFKKLPMYQSTNHKPTNIVTDSLIECLFQIWIPPVPTLSRSNHCAVN